jgi:hypothetical protein
MLITEDEFQRWKEDDVTQMLFGKLKQTREKIKENLVLGLYDTPEFARGKAMCLLDILEMKYEDFVERDDD